jgi:hypothetical protein
MFGPKREEGVGSCRRLLIEGLHNLYHFTKFCWGDHIKEVEMGGTCNMHERMRNAYSILVGKPEGKRPLERPKYRWEDNIRMDLRVMGWEDVEWMLLAHQWHVLVNTVMNL